MRRSLFMLVLAGLAVMGCGDVLDQKSCTAIGCNSQVSATLDTAKLGGALNAKVVACRNGACVEGTIAQNSSQLFCSFPNTGTGNGRGPSCTTQPGSTTAITFSYVLADNEAKDGDTYSFKITGKSGTETVTKEGAVTYQVSRPNGPDCEPVCSQATLN